LVSHPSFGKIELDLEFDCFKDLFKSPWRERNLIKMEIDKNGRWYLDNYTLNKDKNYRNFPN
jgi:hypothetical protein